MQLSCDRTSGSAETTEEIVVSHSFDTIGHLASPIEVLYTGLDYKLPEAGEKSGHHSQSEKYNDDGEYLALSGKGFHLTETNGGDGDNGHVKGFEQAPVPFNRAVSHRPDHNDE